MSVRDEILALEERLRRAELGPDPAVFEELLDDALVIASREGAAFAKPKVVAAHRPGAGPKFASAEWKDLRVVEHGAAAVATCVGEYGLPDGRSFALKFMRVWARKPAGWRVVAASVFE